METSSKEFKDLRMELMHDTANEIDQLKRCINNLDEWLQENGKSIAENCTKSSVPFVVAEYFRSRVKRIQGGLDHFSTKPNNP